MDRKPSAVRSRGFRLPKYVVRGRVINEADKGVAGAVLRIKDDVVLTDDDAGRFFARSNRHRPLPLVVVTAEFRGPAHFSVVSAPALLTPATDDKATDALIVVSRRAPASD